MRYILLLLSILSFVASSNVTYAWWLTKEFQPKEIDAFGIKASDYHPEFTKITMFQCNNNSTFNEEQCNEIKLNNAKFTFVGDFNSDGINETFNIGVAKNLSGEFFYIMSIKDAQNQLVQTLTIKSDKPMFSAMYLIGNKLAWARCMHCGDLAYVTYNGKKWFLDWANDYG